MKELFLDNCRASTVEGLTDQYEELETLSMINLGLTTLKGFPAYPKLRSVRRTVLFISLCRSRIYWTLVGSSRTFVLTRDLD